MNHSLLAAASILLSTVGFLPYAYGIYRRTTKPHLFTWLIWTIVTTLIFIAQLVSGAGPGAWATAAVACMCAIVLIACIFRGEKTRTKFDWVCLTIALATIPLWVISKSPLLSVILLTFLELLGLGPTIRKTLRDPYSESLFYYLLCVLKYLLGAMALDVWIWETALYPVATGIMCFFFCLMTMACRWLRPAPAKS